ncbi:putative carotinoid oxygenase [Operophtera brumata]|uniref:Putative carotinoid oxygenase n=1 Tax=Operophtera brumata TaxID=104452 RepID=A0A0L7L5S3_OPEBR|nr:putative carotinoid oxygenase [Operophtera brumata]
MAEFQKKLYPNCDSSIWLRSCEEEINEPLEGKITGKFAIHNGTVTYQCRFLRTNTLKKNRAANRIVVTEVAAIFKPGESLSDNAMISVYPFGDEIYAFTEGPVIHRVDPVTLDTMERKNLMENLALVNHTSHPHVMPNGVTENYFVIVEQPLTVSLLGVLQNQLSNEPLASSLIWYPKHETHIVLISRKDGKEHKRYRTATLFFLHIINCFEQGGTLLLDLCCYKDAKALDAMYMIKVDTVTGQTKTWCNANCYPSEPIFVPTPNSKEEDDGVLLSALVWGGSRDCEVALLIIDARSMKEIGRAHFHTKSPAPKCLHGWYLPQNVK